LRRAGKITARVAADLVGLIEQEGREGVSETGGRIAVERRRPRRENESSARVEHLCLNDVLTLAANVDAPFDHMRALRLGPVIDKVEIGDRAPPRQAIDETDDGVGVAVDFESRVRPLDQSSRLTLGMPMSLEVVKPWSMLVASLRFRTMPKRNSITSVGLKIRE